MQELNTLLERTDRRAQDRERMVVRSALWAAAGDALGWITELSHGSENVKRRSGSAHVSRPVEWMRVIGGRTGPKVDLPAGTYSDDTQLRLAVSRCIRGDGAFDAEAFAKIELTVWPTYALGGGLGTKAAALSLSRRSTSWFSNFFDSGSQQYVKGGGNGAAMRVQPHVWSAKGSALDLVLSVLRDALVTHGHPQGFCGAVFHALSLHATMTAGAIPPPNEWESFVDTFPEIANIIDRDPQLTSFWRSAWEEQSGVSLETALDHARDEAMLDLKKVQKAAKSMEPGEYGSVLEALGCTTQDFRGAGLKTAIAALVLAYMNRNGSPDAALVQAANELASDTDTIATMAGALLGVPAENEPNWHVQDREYIVQEAKRLADVACGIARESFSYPDLARWTPPASQLASIGCLGDDLAMVGLGLLKPVGKQYRVGDSLWQWCRLPFGQTVLAKRKSNLEAISVDQLPGEPFRTARATQPSPSVRASQQSLGFAEERQLLVPSVPKQHLEEWSLDSATNEAIKSDFEDGIVGRLLNQCIEETGSIERVIAFAAILAKAKLARQRKRR
ncbi:ADP-ribosylglycohydrolase family protein [Acidovorax sp. SUPP3434]|uniref:ADP-ribosylglycohydrolase family protein n=1 Tax=Acidovorax sp. SUPP3434 TaxID=2920880 RepID=UPI0023DE50EC|nr:ADP-ribosylglycohydrolase family protein [Acidovorax sp. SUPP3434]GKT01995.1 ADP-ribosylglycohydrolase family protein [Acidovorax sp. SUPP3434]